MTKAWKTETRVYDTKAGDFVTVKLSVDIDWPALAKFLAIAARKNKSGVTRFQGGLIKARIVS